MILDQLDAEEGSPIEKSEYFLSTYNSKKGEGQVRVTSCLSKT